MLAQLARFGLVGLAATLTHFLVAVSCVRVLALEPQLANVAGFLVAFTVSFAGQWRWTFRASAAPLARALPSYFAISVAGFLLNAAAYRWLLGHSALRYDVALALVLLGVAGLTFVLSRLWAFGRAR